MNWFNKNNPEHWLVVVVVAIVGTDLAITLLGFL